MDFRFFIARRYLASRRRVSLISIITGISIAGVGLGVAALIVVLSVMNGFYAFVRDLLVSVDPHVRIESVGEGGLVHSDSLVEVALALPHVQEAAPYVEGKALLLREDGAEGDRVLVVRGVDERMVGNVSEVATLSGFGTFELERRDGLPGIVVGRQLGHRLSLVPVGGDRPPSTVALLSAPGIERTLTQVFAGPQVHRFEVRGLYDVDAAYDDNHVFIGLDEAQRLFRKGEAVSGIELRLDDLNRAETVKAALQARLDPTRYRVRTWYDLQKSLYDVMQLEKWGASLILALIIVVAAFNIVGSLTMIVIEKRRDIGALQAMGVSRRDVRRIFLLEGLLIGLIGTGLGAILGLGLALAQQHFELVPLAGSESFIIRAYPIAVQPLDLVVIVVVALLLCVLAAVYPATRAASIEPASAVQVDG